MKIDAGVLPNDVARCHDEQCQVRERCERWKQRNSGQTYVVHATTLRPAWRCWDEPCDYAIGDFEKSE
jgi:hypothetical protein